MAINFETKRQFITLHSLGIIFLFFQQLRFSTNAAEPTRN